MHRLYENADLAVFWNSDKCYHARQCVTGSPGTFDKDRRPWIDLSLAPNEEIWKAIEKCPSGALKVVYKHEVEVVFEPEKCHSIAMDNKNVIGECDYEITTAGWNIYHTEVDPKYSGKGIAKRLVYKVLEAADRSNVKYSATCSYAEKIIGEQ